MIEPLTCGLQLAVESSLLFNFLSLDPLTIDGHIVVINARRKRLAHGRRYWPLKSEDNNLAIRYDCVADEFGAHALEGGEPFHGVDENRSE